MKSAIGIMSGTSVDAIDVVLIEFTPQFLTVRVAAFSSQPFDSATRKKILRNTNPETSSVSEIAELNIELSRLAAVGVSDVLRKSGKNPHDVLCVGYHGQTLWHDPKSHVTYQIGDGPTLAALTGLAVVNNFRTKDMAHGGEGAPLVPFAHKILFHKNPEEKIAVHNLGGISNPVYFSRNQMLAFDTGPANLLLDGLMEKLCGQHFDENGRLAKQGLANLEIAAHFLQNDYFAKHPPKSTGREEFGKDFLAEWIKKINAAKLSNADAMATAVEFVVQTIAKAYRDFILPNGLDQIIFCGGGAKNLFLLERLGKEIPVAIETSDYFGFDPQTVECVAFAVLGCFAFEKKVNQIPSLTGAKKASCLGQISWPD